MRTWSRPCVAISGPTGQEDAQARCGGTGDPRYPGDGTVNFIQDNDTVANASVPFNDKEWGTAGPRPAGVTPTCFAPITKTPLLAASSSADRNAPAISTSSARIG